VPALIQVGKATYDLVWTLVFALVIGGWIVFALLAAGNKVFFTAMVVLSSVGWAIPAAIFRSRDEQG
jgi:hypothetical protein